MKKIRPYLLGLLAIAAVSTACPPDASAQKGEKTFGIKTGYITRNKSALAGIEFSYRFSKHFMLNPNIDYAFRNNNIDAFLFNIDTAYPIAIGSPRAEIYPIAGLNYSSWNSRVPDEEDSSVRTSRFGLNAGIGFIYKVTPTLRLNASARFTAVKRVSTGLFNIGIGYCF